MLKKRAFHRLFKKCFGIPKTCRTFVSTKTNNNPKNKIMRLNFGKHKGQNFNETPKSYQSWLLSQAWFKMPESTPLHQQLNGWDGHSRKGQAIYDAIFEQEKAESDRMYCDCGNMKEPSEKYCGWGCIAEM